MKAGLDELESDQEVGVPKSAIQELYEWVIMNVSCSWEVIVLFVVAIRGQECERGDGEFQGLYRTS